MQSRPTLGTTTSRSDLAAPGQSKGAVVAPRVRPNQSVEATRNGMGRSSASGLSSPPRPMPLRAPHLKR
jgi:hypothetical protein